MEETLGKRIVSNRKKLKLTQDALAEKLGVTAQAVSKWENDQSCPDITMLPRLAEIFGITTDALLGLEAPAREAEPVTENPPGLHIDNNDGRWEFQWDGGRKSHMGLAFWVISAGSMLLASAVLNRSTDLWTAFWTTGLAVFGLFGLWPKFSFFRFGCGLLGGYFIVNELSPDLFMLKKSYLLPIFLVLFGLSLLADALKKNRDPIFRITSGGNGKHRQHYHTDGETFTCGLSFGEMTRRVELPRLSRGTVDVSFGDMTLDLSGCESFAEGSTIDANCSFGELSILIPAAVRAERAASSSFAELNISGHPDPAATQSVFINCNASFGEITLRYI